MLTLEMNLYTEPGTERTVLAGIKSIEEVADSTVTFSGVVLRFHAETTEHAKEINLKIRKLPNIYSTVTQLIDSQPPVKA